jgi:WD40 repeat protein
MKKAIFILIILFPLLESQSQTPEVSITTGHSKVIMKVALAPTGNLIATNSINHIIKIWDRNSGKEITNLSNKVKGIDNEQRIESMKFFDDGLHLLTTDENGTVKVWDIKKEETLRTFEGQYGLQGLNADISGKRILYIGKDLNLNITDLDNELNKKISGYRFMNVGFIPDNQDQIYAVDIYGKFFIYDIIEEKEVLNFEHKGGTFLKVAVSPNGKYLAGIKADLSVSIWDTKSGSVVKELLKGNALEIKFHPLSKQLAILNKGISQQSNKLSIYNANTFKLKREIDNIGMYATFFSLSKNGKYIATNSMEMINRTMSNTVNILSWRNGERITTLKSRVQGVSKVVSAKNSPRIVSLSYDLNVRVWNISTLQTEMVFPYVQNIAMNAEGNTLALKGYYKEAPGYDAVRLWDIDSMRLIDYIPTSGNFTDMRFCADGKHIAAFSYDGTIKVWNTDTKKIVIKTDNLGMFCQSIDISPDLKYIAYTASGTPSITIYNTETKKKTVIENAHPLLGASDLKFSSDGKYLLSGSYDKEVVAWETGTWERSKDYTGNLGPVYCVNYSFDNTIAASGSMGSTVSESDYAVHVWNALTGNKKCKLLGHEQRVNSIAINNTNKLLFSGSDDGSIKVWSLDSCKEIMSCIGIGYDDYIFVTPDNFYTGSKDALKGVGFKMDGTKLLPFEQYDLWLNRPDTIAERLGIASGNLIKAFKKAYIKRIQKMGFNNKEFNKDYHIPEIFIKNKENIPLQANGNEISIEILARDEKYPLDRINIWINDVPIYGRQGIDLNSENKKELHKKLKFQLSEGKNKVQVSVLNSNRTESLKETFEIIAPKRSKKPDLYIVAVGVSDHKDENLNLDYAAKDATDLTSIFEGKTDRFENIHITKVLNYDATRDNILKTKEILKNSDINDLVIVYTAGHGFLDDEQDYYFVTTDFKENEPKVNGLPYDQLESLLHDIPARKKLLLMDACHSGEVDKADEDTVKVKINENIVVRGVYQSKSSEKSIGLDNSFRLMKELFADLRRGSGAVVISSAAGAEYAFEGKMMVDGQIKSIKNGVFTYVLINGLRHKKANSNTDNIITISELQKYVLRRVSEVTTGLQNPTTRQENLEFDFVVW